MDQPLVRNVLYMAWAMLGNGVGGGGGGNVFLQGEDAAATAGVPDGCIAWQVQTKQDSYLALISLSKAFTVSLQDLQAIADVNPVRIDSVFIRNPENDAPGVGAVLAVKILNQDQPVRVTEADVIRIKKRHRGWFG